MKTKPYNINNPVIIEARNLSIGEMMIADGMHVDYRNHILLMTYAGVISLSDPEITWDKDCTLTGRKLLPGEGITLIQE
jgi:hypothetical protein